MQPRQRLKALRVESFASRRSCLTKQSRVAAAPSTRISLSFVAWAEWLPGPDSVILAVRSTLPNSHFFMHETEASSYHAGSFIRQSSPAIPEGLDGRGSLTQPAATARLEKPAQVCSSSSRPAVVLRPRPFKRAVLSPPTTWH